MKFLNWLQTDTKTGIKTMSVLVIKVMRNSSRFSRAHSIIAAYIFMVLISALCIAIYGSLVIKKSADGIEEMTVNVECTSNRGTTDVCYEKLYIGATSYLLTISAGLSEIANWGLACLFYFTTIVMNLSLQWETIIKEALGLLKS